MNSGSERRADPSVSGEPPINLVPAMLVAHLGTTVLAVSGQELPEHLRDAVAGRRW